MSIAFLWERDRHEHPMRICCGNTHLVMCGFMSGILSVSLVLLQGFFFRCHPLGYLCLFLLHCLVGLFRFKHCALLLPFAMWLPFFMAEPLTSKGSNHMQALQGECRHGLSVLNMSGRATALFCTIQKGDTCIT